MKRSLGLLLILAVFIGCSAKGDQSTETGGKIEVMASLFPQYDFAKIIGGDKVNVTLLLPPGVESHSFEPTPQDVIHIQKSDVFLYTGEVMEPWVHEMMEGSAPKSLKTIDLSGGIDLIDSSGDLENDHNGTSEGDHKHGVKDPHFWTDPNNAKIMIHSILKSFIDKSPENEEYFTDNAENLLEQMNELDKEFKELVSGKDHPSIIFGGHQAFGYLSYRYGIDIISAYKNLSPNADVAPQAMAELIELMNDRDKKVVYYEELVEPKIAQAISEATGAELVLLHATHNVSKEELNSGVHYFDLMKQNIKALQKGLE